MPTLFDPLKAGRPRLAQSHRHGAADPLAARIPTAACPATWRWNITASAPGFGLIISEATSVTPMGVGYAATPGIWSDEQTEGWKKITRAVHARGRAHAAAALACGPHFRSACF